RLEDDRAGCAIEAERALHERALRAAEIAHVIERARRVVAVEKTFDHDRAIEHRVDRARELADRRGAERRLELVARAGFVLVALCERRDRVRPGRALLARADLRAAAEVERLELVAQLGERRRALLRI